MSDFHAVQRQLSDHIRDPSAHAGPAGVEERRLAIYRDLFYRNIEGFISSGFPVLRSLYTDEAWESLVRDFMASHRCRTPYFLEISQEFLAYLDGGRTVQPEDPPFLEELAHYEWVELALDVAEDNPADIAADPDGDLIEGVPVPSPLAWSLAYRYPVHRIGPAYRPAEPPDEPTFLVVYRNREEAVKFLEINAVTARLFALMEETAGRSGRELLEQIASEMRHAEPETLVAHGRGLLERLRELDIVLGSVV